VLRPIEILPNRRPDGTHCPSDYCPYSSSVTKMGSEVPILATACALRSTRLAALTVHRTVIHYRQLRFAYLGGSAGRSAPQQPPNRTINSNLHFRHIALAFRYLTNGKNRAKIVPLAAVVEQADTRDLKSSTARLKFF